MQKETTIFYTPQLRELWPAPLAQSWAATYPCLFDADDLRITPDQPRNHFNEWFAAIHLFHRDGALSLVEKYLYKSHPWKKAAIEHILHPEQRRILNGILTEFKVQPPDLLVFAPSRSAFHFAEIKGPGDRLRPLQRASHKAIQQRLGVPVEHINVRLSAVPRLDHNGAHPEMTRTRDKSTI